MQSSQEAEKSELQAALTENQQQIEQLNQQIESSAQQCQELEQIAAEGSKSKDSYQIELNELKARYEQLATEHQAEQQRRQQLDAELAERDQNLELFQVDLSSVRAELDRSEQQLKHLEEERTTLNLQLTGLRDELAAQESNLAPEQQSLQSKLQLERDELAEQLNSVRSQLEELQIEKTEDTQPELPTQEEATCESVDSEEQDATSASAEESDVPASSPNDTTLTGISPDESVYPFDVSGADFSGISRPSQEKSESSSPSAELEGQEVEYEEQADDEVSWDIPTQHSATDDEEVSEYSAAAFAAGETPPVVESDLEETEDYVTTDYQSSGIAEADATTAEYEDEFAEHTFDEPELVLEAQPEELVENIESAPSPLVPETPEVDPSEESAEEFKPTSFIDQYAHLLDEDGDTNDEPVQPEPAQPAPVENKLGAELDAMQGEHDDDSDEALQAYMSNMLRRMRGDSNDDEATPPQPTQTTQLNQDPNPVAAVSEVLSNVAPQEVPEPVNEDPIDLESLKRTSEKPDLPTDLAAMRELANASARKAIAKHHKKRHLEKAMGLFLVCLISICVGGYLLITATAAQDYTGVKFIGGAIAALLGVGGGLKLMGLLLAAIREGSSPATKPAK